MKPGSLPALRITVKGSKVAGVEVLTSAPPGNPTSLPGETVDGLFDELQSGFPTTPGKCTGLELNLDPSDGHPLNASFGTEEESIQDGGGGFSVSNFTRL
ncbi:hypothetical protein GCM10008957_06050 [Deinococcus ruber]|uniref:Uncharacterized protein n=2 Tax=Deinococcus ruber TaxID=1848197 RepID=A0A918F321_9DEIO|nr:hypothetical protein GCM10008957_06050 [Deinococcus ruber]